MPLGINFAPTDQNQQENRPAGTPIQDAIKILSLRIPSFVGAQGIAPNALLQGGGTGGFPFGGQTPGGLDEFLRRLFQGGGQGPAPMGGFPSPNITPGGEAGTAPPQSPTRSISNVPNPPQQGESGPGGLITPPSIQPGGGERRPPLMTGRPPFQQLR